MLGLTRTSVPMASLLPQGQPGCALLAAPDAWSLLPQTSSRSAYTLDVPNNPGLVGVVVHHQILVIETPASGGFGPATATNGLTLVVGSAR